MNSGIQFPIIQRKKAFFEYEKLPGNTFIQTDNLQNYANFYQKQTHLHLDYSNDKAIFLQVKPPEIFDFKRPKFSIEPVKKGVFDFCFISWAWDGSMRGNFTFLGVRKDLVKKHY